MTPLVSASKVMPVDGVARDQIPFAGVGAADRPAGRGDDPDAVAAVGDRRRAGEVGADVVALDLAAGAAQHHADAGVSRDDVALAGGVAAEGVVGAAEVTPPPFGSAAVPAR